MKWAFLLVLIPTLCYLGTAIVYALRQDWPSTVIFLGYSLANTGFLVIEWAK